MTRMQITIDPADRARVQRKAADAGISIAEYVRRLIARDLGGSPPAAADVSELFGIGRSGGADVARHGKTYLAEAADAAARR